MTGDLTSNSTDDEAVFADLGRQLADAVEMAVPVWVKQCVILRAGPDAAAATANAVTAAGHRGADDIGGALRELLALDLDQQWTNPLSIVRGAARYPTEILTELGVPPVPRDRFAAEQDPEDVYDLTPAAFADFGPDVHERGIMWGAAKAHLHLQRRKADRAAEAG